MGIQYILYNPSAGNGKCREKIVGLENDQTVSVSMEKVTSYRTFFEGLEEDASVILCGGDGTLNRFINDVRDIEIRVPVYYYAVGSGNDFARDLGHSAGDLPDYEIGPYLKNLPEVTVNGKKFLFLNGIGYGIDGYCCQEGDRLREKNAAEHTDAPINYTAIAIKGLLFHYHPKRAVVTVDGVRHEFKRVWLAPVMHGTYYGGGMIPTPGQNRSDPSGTLSVMVFHNCGKLKALMIFPGIFKGEHIRHKKQVTVLRGKEITVEFDRPTPLQIDGETVLGVTSYTAVSHGQKASPAGKAEAVRNA